VLDVTGLAGATDLSLANGQTIKGNGTVLGNVTVASGSSVSPGSSPGTLTASSMTWSPGGHYVWEVNQVSGSGVQTTGSDPGADKISVTGALTLPGSPSFNIDITGLNTSNVSGGVNNWNPHNSYSWVIANAGSISGSFSTSNFSLNTSAFTNNNS